ncbi:hypothetical protein RADP37_05221 [Roseomonas mucosa]|uniref:Uncharacterized protein n=1 Tax=Roseomonas mucosa TaxID=207340 RepID=A0A4Y1MWR2_9PROT|nr:hypothetical protein RADP37_05221 [Roseomonas mucosa]
MTSGACAGPSAGSVQRGPPGLSGEPQPQSRESGGGGGEAVCALARQGSSRIKASTRARIWSPRSLWDGQARADSYGMARPGSAGSYRERTGRPSETADRPEMQAGPEIGGSGIMGDDAESENRPAGDTARPHVHPRSALIRTQRRPLCFLSLNSARFRLPMTLIIQSLMSYTRCCDDFFCVVTKLFCAEGRVQSDAGRAVLSPSRVMRRIAARSVLHT